MVSTIPRSIPQDPISPQNDPQMLEKVDTFVMQHLPCEKQCADPCSAAKWIQIVKFHGLNISKIVAKMSNKYEQLQAQKQENNHERN